MLRSSLLLLLAACSSPVTHIDRAPVTVEDAAPPPDAGASDAMTNRQATVTLADPYCAWRDRCGSSLPVAGCVSAVQSLSYEQDAGPTACDVARCQGILTNWGCVAKPPACDGCGLPVDP